MEQTYTNVKDEEKNSNQIILKVINLSKHFGGIKAVDNVSLEFYKSEIVGIVGDNGAGKSTLIKMISGAYERDSGEIYLDGQLVNVKNTADAIKLGIETVYQNNTLVGHLDAPKNFFLGRERVTDTLWGKIFGSLDMKGMRQDTLNTLKKLKIDLKDIYAPVKLLSGGQQQSVVVGRAAYWKGKVIILDEPANNLGVQEQREVLKLVQSIRDEYGITFIMISHNLEHVFDISDRIVVMRGGRVVGVKKTSETSRNEIVGLITGAIEVN